MAKRGRKPNPNKRRGYFHEEEEQAFVQYLQSDDKDEKETIFRYKLLPPLTKMVESIIRRYNLYTPEEDFSDTFNDTMSFLLSKIDNFNPESGYKAYSYCGTICKNYLIFKINQYNKNIKRNERYELVKDEVNNNIKYSYSPYSDKIKHLTELIVGTTNKIKDMVCNKDKFKLSENEIKVGNALIDLLANWEDLFSRMGSNKFNKSSILLFLKEITLLDTKEIRDGMRKYKNVYKELRKKMIDDIYIDVL